MPDGITPLEFDIMEEAVAYLDSIYATLEAPVEVETVEIPTIQPYHVGAETQRFSTSTVHNTGIAGMSSTFTINLYTDYYAICTCDFEPAPPGFIGPWPQPEYNVIIESALPSCYLSGFVPGISMTIGTINAMISSNQKSFETFARGSLQYSVIVEGIGKVFEGPFSVSHRDTVPQFWTQF